jgi:hypothetical protein
MANLTQVIRPFRGLEKLDELAELVSIRFGDTQIESGRSATADSPIDFLNRAIEISVPYGSADGQVSQDLEEALEQASLRPQDVDFLILSTTRALRRSDVLTKINLAENSLPQKFPVKERPPSLRASTNGTDIEVMLVLADDLEPAFAKPHRKGTWLCRSKFTLQAQSKGRGFELHPLTEVVRKQHSLGSGVPWFIHVTGEEEQMSEENKQLGDVVRIYVEQTLLNRLRVVEHEPDSQLVQMQIVLDTYRAVVTRILSDRQEDEPRDLPPINSPFGELLKARLEIDQRNDEQMELSLARFLDETEGFIADLSHQHELDRYVSKALEKPE